MRSRQSRRGMMMHTAARLALSVALVLLAPQLPAAENAGKAQYGSWGFDNAGEDTAVKPGDNFFRYANGHWLDTHQIPPDKPGVSLRLEMTDRTEARLHEMMEAAAAKASHQPADLEGKMGA